MDNTKMNFSCEGKCRICPYPGSLCKEKNQIYRNPIEHIRDDAAPYIDRELQDKILREKGLI